MSMDSNQSRNESEHFHRLPNPPSSFDALPESGSSPAAVLLRHLRLLGAMLKIRLGRQMMYRASFWTAFFVDGTLFLVQLAIFSTLFLNVESVNGWSQEQMVFFVGTFSLVDGLEMCFYFFGLISLPEKIRDGKLDLYLTKPVNPLFFLSFESIDVGSALLTLPGIVMVVWATMKMGISVTPLLVIGYLFLLVLMLLLLYDLVLLMRCAAFWFTRTDALGELEGELMGFTFRVPGVVFQGAMKTILYVLLPYALLATIPTQFFTGILNGREWLSTLAVTLAFTLLARFVWKQGLKRYGSTGS